MTLAAPVVTLIIAVPMAAAIAIFFWSLDRISKERTAPVTIEQAARAAGHDITVPFTPGRTDASQAQTDHASYAVLEPKDDGFRNFLSGNQTRRPEEMLLDRAHRQYRQRPRVTRRSDFGASQCSPFVRAPPCVRHCHLLRKRRHFASKRRDGIGWTDEFHKAAAMS